MALRVNRGFDNSSYAAGVLEQLSSYFGYGIDKRDEGWYYSNNQVFKKSLLLPICQKLVSLKAAGKPAVIKETLEVLPNNYWGIKGGYKVGAMFFQSWLFDRSMMKYVYDIYIYMIDSYMMVKTVLNIWGFGCSNRSCQLFNGGNATLSW